MIPHSEALQKTSFSAVSEMNITTMKVHPHSTIVPPTALLMRLHQCLRLSNAPLRLPATDSGPKNIRKPKAVMIYPIFSAAGGFLVSSSIPPAISAASATQLARSART
jgi:hypothetical protein